MDTIYDTLAKLNKVANAPEIVKEDSNALMKKGLEDLMKKTKFNKQADYKPFGKGDKDYETGLPKDAKKDKMFDDMKGDMKAADAAKMNKQKNYTPFSDKQSPDGLPEKKKDTKMFEKESDVERDDRAEKAGREVERDAKYDGMKHAKKDGKSVTKDIEYDEKHDKDGMHEAEMKMVKGPDGKMVPHFAADGKGKNDLKKEETEVHENAGTLKDAARQGVLARLAELAGVPAQEIEEALGTPQDIANKIMSETDLNERMSRDELDIDDEDNLMSAEELKKELIDDLNHLYDKASKDDFTDTDHIIDEMGDYFNDMHVNADDMTLEVYGMARDLADADPAEVIQMAEKGIKALGGMIESISEADVEEGNEFSGARDDAIKAGKDSFEVDGKTYPVKGDKKTEAIEEAEHDGMPSMKEMKACVDKGMTEAEICEKYSDCDQKKIKLMASKCSKMNEGTGSKVCDQCEDGKDEDGKECSECGGTGYSDLAEESEEKVEETTSAGSVATSEGPDKTAFPNASIYEKYEGNEIAQRAFQINEDMNITVSAGSEQEPSINISAQGEEAAKLAQLLKLAGMGMAQPGYGEVQVDVAEDQEFANGADATETKDAEYMTQDIAGGLNGPKKMAYPKVAGADNPMSVLGESELNEVSEDHLMKLYQEYKAK